MFTPSRYQSAIFAFIDSGNGHAVVDAGPGSGKTTTCLEAADRLPEGVNAIFLAFGNKIAEATEKELKARAEASGKPQRMTASTIHSLGKSFLGPCRREAGKYRQIAKSVLTPFSDSLTQSAYSFSALAGKLYNLVDLTMQTLTVPTERNLQDLAEHYDLDIDFQDVSWPHIWRNVQPCIDEGVKIYRFAKIIDFIDMIYLPVKLNLSCKQFDVIFVDEAQDLNKCELELVTRCAVNGRIIAVGDKRQSMFGFAGADTRSIPNIIERLNATVLPLSICYRCPPNITALAAQVYPGIEPGFKPAGVIEVIKEDELIATAKQGDLVLARMNAPLVSECLRFLRAGIKAQVLGKDIGTMFVGLVKELSGRMGYALETLGRLAEDYRRQQIARKINVPNSELEIDKINDKIDTFVALYEAYLDKANGSGSIAGFNAYLEAFFTDNVNGSNPIVFSTVHKAKGLEYDNVFILGPSKFPHPAAKKAWQMEQEYNILYVALTRAKKSLRFVGGLVDCLTLDQQPATQPFITVQEVQVSDLLGEYTAYVANEREPLPPIKTVVYEAPGAHAAIDTIIGTFKPAQEQDVCPSCGAEADTSGICCWSCGFKFDNALIDFMMDEAALKHERQIDGYLAQGEAAMLQAEPFMSKTIMTENAAPKTSWVQPPKAHAKKQGRKPVDHSHGRKPMDGKTPKTYIQLSIPTEMYERIAAMKAAGEIESASALFEALFKARY